MRLALGIAVLSLAIAVSVVAIRRILSLRASIDQPQRQLIKTARKRIAEARAAARRTDKELHTVKSEFAELIDPKGRKLASWGGATLFQRWIDLPTGGGSVADIEVSVQTVGNEIWLLVNGPTFAGIASAKVANKDEAKKGVDFAARVKSQIAIAKTEEQTRPDAVLALNSRHAEISASTTDIEAVTRARETASAIDPQHAWRLDLVVLDLGGERVLSRDSVAYSYEPPEDWTANASAARSAYLRLVRRARVGVAVAVVASLWIIAGIDQWRDDPQVAAQPESISIQPTLPSTTSTTTTTEAPGIAEYLTDLPYVDENSDPELVKVAQRLLTVRCCRTTIDGVWGDKTAASMVTLREALGLPAGYLDVAVWEVVFSQVGPTPERWTTASLESVPVPEESLEIPSDAAGLSVANSTRHVVPYAVEHAEYVRRYRDDVAGKPLGSWRWCDSDEGLFDQPLRMFWWKPSGEMLSVILVDRGAGRLDIDIVVESEVPLDGCAGYEPPTENSGSSGGTFPEPGSARDTDAYLTYLIIRAPTLSMTLPEANMLEIGETVCQILDDGGGGSGVAEELAYAVSSTGLENLSSEFAGLAAAATAYLCPRHWGVFG